MSLLKSFVAVIAVIVLAGIGYLLYEAAINQDQIASFDDCIAAGYPASDDQPAQCETPNGEIFVADINDPAIASFAECVAAGYPVMESYPEQCQTANGQTFSRNIGNELEKADLILTDNPRPNQSIASPLAVTGEARGPWFFEATFPITLVDDNGKELVRTFAEADGDWMTEDFVPFSANLTFNSPTTKTGQLILEKANPSGLPEQADTLIIPIIFSSFSDSQNPTSNRAQDGCIITGCSNQVCADQEVATTCEYKESYACYRTAVCGRNTAGQCNWQETPTLIQCLESSN